MELALAAAGRLAEQVSVRARVAFVQLWAQARAVFLRQEVQA